MVVLRVLNERFTCNHCHARGRWVISRRSVKRQLSVIHWLRCTNCGQQIVAKTSRDGISEEGGRERLRKEYELLKKLQTVFPQDASYATLEPFGYLESTACGIMVTRRFYGIDLVHLSRAADDTGVHEAFYSAGVWLRKLHACGGKQNEQRTLDVLEKVVDLRRAYGQFLYHDKETRTACNLLEAEAKGIGTLDVPVVRIHGDFKPENMLCGGGRYLGLDIQWQSTGSAVYDLAPFLNHLWIAGFTWRRTRADCRKQMAEVAFLDGYGGVESLRALRWAQLYFALSYVGGYRMGGWLRPSYAALRVLPMMRQVVNQLRAGR